MILIIHYLTDERFEDKKAYNVESHASGCELYRSKREEPDDEMGELIGMSILPDGAYHGAIEEA